MLEHLLEVKNVTKVYSARSRTGAAAQLTAVNGVTLSIEPGRTVGLVGESGSGKSTLGRIMAGLEPPDSGQTLLDGRPLTDSKKIFGRSVQMIFQNPMNALNPRWTVRSVLSEPFVVNGQAHRSADLELLLEEVRLPKTFLARRPGELSGGERQRICIARALALKPRYVICDEAVSSLDVLVRAGILNLLLELQERHGIGYLFISHDLAVVAHMSDRVAVMRQGSIVEAGAAADVIGGPRESYTRSLFEAARFLDGEEKN